MKPRLLIILAIALGLAACSPYAVHEFEQPLVEVVDVPDEFHETSVNSEDPPRPAVDRWWSEFEDGELDRVVDQALAQNLDLRISWSRLEQARARAVIAGAPRYPTLDLNAGAQRSQFIDRNERRPDGRRLRQTDSRYFIGSGIGWEIDLWRRIASQTEAESLRLEASRQDVEQTALLLTGAIAEAWFTIAEQGELIRLRGEQVETSETLLELTELRFSLGDGTALDVLQQRQQLAATRSAVPPADAVRDVALHQLAVLLGRAPGDLEDVIPSDQLPELPVFPALPGPANLLETRPDLRAAFVRLRASDYDVAAAVADRFPRLTLSLSYEFSATNTSDFFHQQTGSILGSLFTPLVDGGRRRAEVERRRAVVQEQLDTLGALYLDALREVEDALSRERRQLDLLDRLVEQLLLARSNLEESRSRYSTGLTNYLDVIIAVQSLQDLERRIISERRALLSIRAELYRALGGSWTHDLVAPAPHDLARTDTMERSPAR